MFDIVHNDGVWWWGLVAAGEGVWRYWKEFDDREDWVEVPQRRGEFQLICGLPDRSDYLEGAKAEGV